MTRLLHPEPVRASVMLVAAAVASLANAGSVLLFRTPSAEDINVRSAFLHLAQDALASLAVVVAALFARTPAGRCVDPAAAILIGAVVLRRSISIVRESLHTLLEAASVGANVDLRFSALRNAASPGRADWRPALRIAAVEISVTY